MADPSRRRIIGNVPALGWGKHRETTFGGALEAASAVTAHPVCYDTLMGATGLAFRMRWYEGNPGTARWCPSSAVGEFPEEMEAARKATGWELSALVEFERRPPEAEFVPRLVASLDAGQPVLCYDSQSNLAVLIGYEEGGQTLLCHDYGHPGQPQRVSAAQIPVFFVWLGEHRPALPRREALIQALSIAARNWHRPPLEGARGRYWYGAGAYRKWAEELTRAAELSAEERDRLFFVGWWCFNALEDARASAARYLEAHRGVLNAQADLHLTRALECYSSSFHELIEPRHGRKDAFLGPWSGKSIHDWTREVISCERQVLVLLSRSEGQAIAEIEQALAAEGVAVEPLGERA